jgi:hypothetical protein
MPIQPPEHDGENSAVREKAIGQLCLAILDVCPGPGVSGCGQRWLHWRDRAMLEPWALKEDEKKTASKANHAWKGSCLASWLHLSCASQISPPWSKMEAQAPMIPDPGSCLLCLFQYSTIKTLISIETEKSSINSRAIHIVILVFLCSLIASFLACCYLLCLAPAVPSRLLGRSMRLSFSPGLRRVSALQSNIRRFQSSSLLRNSAMASNPKPDPVWSPQQGKCCS